MQVLKYPEVKERSAQRIKGNGSEKREMEDTAYKKLYVNYISVSLGERTLNTFLKNIF